MGRRAFTFLELLISLAVVGVLVVILLPALSSARASSLRACCAGNQRVLGQAWDACVHDNDGRFPVLYVQPEWQYGGVRFSSIDGSPFIDHNRPLSRYVPGNHLDTPGDLFQCPADDGITDVHGKIGTGRRSAYRAFGTSYRANPQLLGPRPDSDAGLLRDDITTTASRLVIMGDPIWYEMRQKTGRLAAWHGDAMAGNLLFLDGSVRFVLVAPGPKVGPAVFDPLAPELAFPLKKPQG